MHRLNERTLNDSQPVIGQAQVWLCGGSEDIPKSAMISARLLDDTRCVGSRSPSKTPLRQLSINWLVEAVEAVEIKLWDDKHF